MKPALDFVDETVLVVDDVPDNVDILVISLEHAGHKVVVARDGAQALERAATLRPDLILLDVLMPGLDGFEVCRRLKASPATADIPVIFMTASSERTDQFRAFEVGGVDYITKPFQVAEVLARVGVHLALRRTQTELASRNEQLSFQIDELKASNRKLEQMHVQLLQSEKMASIGQLAAGVAHEINNPIGFVSSNLGSLETYVHGLLRLLACYERHEPALVSRDEKISREIGAIKQAIELDYLKQDVPALLSESKDGLLRVKKIVQDLKDFSHAGKGEWQNADLHAGLDSTLNIVNNEIKYKATVNKRFGTLPQIECMPLELNQVFMNLLVNAGQAIAERGEISIHTGTASEHVWVEISDTGAGVAPENLNRIFDPFFTTKPVGKGAGLGLAISYGIVQKHYGRIDVTSEPGKGATFRVTLPIKQPTAMSKSEAIGDSAGSTVALARATGFGGAKLALREIPPTPPAQAGAQ